jgi:hypothetical protein
MRADWLSHRRCDRSGIDLPAVIVTGEPGLQQALRRRCGGHAIQATPAVCR